MEIYEQPQQQQQQQYKNGVHAPLVFVCIDIV